MSIAMPAMQYRACATPYPPPQPHRPLHTTKLFLLPPQYHVRVQTKSQASLPLRVPIHIIPTARAKKLQDLIYYRRPTSVGLKET